MKQYQVGVYIGCFQPFHLGYKFVTEASLQQCDKLIIVIGSAKTWRTESNPFSFEERVALIRESLSDEHNQRVEIVGVRDYYKDKMWNQAVVDQVNSFVQPNDEVALFGHIKDESSYYLEHFPKWSFVYIVNHQ